MTRTDSSVGGGSVLGPAGAWTVSVAADAMDERDAQSALWGVVPASAREWGNWRADAEMQAWLPA